MKSFLFMIPAGFRRNSPLLPRRLLLAAGAAMAGVAIPGAAASAADQREIGGAPFLTFPVAANHRVISGFGMRLNPVSGDKSFHKGVDIAAPIRSRVVAAREGVVVHAGLRDGYGVVVEIDHGDDLVTRYAHLDTAYPVAGARVRAGDLIGLVGSSGRGTGPRLHFEVHCAGAPTDPAAFFPAQARARPVGARESAAERSSCLPGEAADRGAP